MKFKYYIPLNFIYNFNIYKHNFCQRFMYALCKTLKISLESGVLKSRGMVL